MALTPRQRKFATVYAGNGAAACRAAGYKGSVQALSTQAKRLLNNPEVARAIAAREQREERKAILTRQQRQELWSTIASDKKASIFARLKASELLGRSEADFVERHEHSGSIAVQVVDPYAEPKK